LSKFKYTHLKIRDFKIVLIIIKSLFEIRYY